MNETVLEESRSFDRHVLAYIHQAAECGLYDIRGLGAKRRVPSFRRPGVPDRVGFALSARGLSRALQHRDTLLGTRHAKRPIELAIPITVAGMSFGALSANGQRSHRPCRHRTRHIDHDRRRRHDARGTPFVKTLVYQCLPSRYGFNPDDLRQADAIEVVDRPGSQAGRRRHAAWARKSVRAWPRCARCPTASTSDRRAGTRTGPGPTI